MTIVLAFLALAAAQPADTGAGGYWQQQVSYDITARLDEKKGVLGGTERVFYVNRSPDTLTTFSLHLYLNAFRPGSRWSDADSVEHRRRFNDLKDPDFGFNHVRDVRIMGRLVTPIYPLAPDSTIVRFDLPAPLAPGDSMTVDMNWDARPSTVPRRQGRQGRRFDFAEWYPKVVVYDRHGWEEHALYPAGEFYGEFATFTVRLDVPEDQVVGGTGVPVCGDPGWERANRGTAPVDYQRDYYGAASASLANACDGAGPGYKRIVWYAEQVHHFALSLNPQYRYEGGRYGNTVVHVLYQPGDSLTWGKGVAVQRTETALAWLGGLYGPFGWPQITNVHRIEGGGTEFPMMIMDGSADQGLIVHELGHNYTMGMLANNEWREGWLDEGFTSFQTSWFWETHGRGDAYPRLEPFLLTLDLDGMSEPASLVSEDYRDFISYNISIYNRGEFFFDELRYVVGDDVMRRILRTFFERYRFRHVDEAAFRSVAEDVSKRDLSTFFAQWLHSTDLVDYAVGRVRRRALPGGRWQTRVEVVRREPGRIPVQVAVLSATDTAVAWTDGLAERAWVTVETRGKPRRVVLDPRVRTHDWNMLNNERRFGFGLRSLLGPTPAVAYLDTWIREPVRRDARAVGFSPTAWFNDFGGFTFGFRTRENYLGRFEQNQTWLNYSTGWGHSDSASGKHLDLMVRFRNPVWLRAPGLTTTFEGYLVEGRVGARAALDQRWRRHLTYGPTWTAGASLQWVGTRKYGYLDPAEYDNAGTVEGELHAGVEDEWGPWSLRFRGSAGGGLGYTNPGPGVVAPSRYDLGGYGRAWVEGTARREWGSHFRVALRLFGGTLVTHGPKLRQRQFFLGGAGPYDQLWNPLTRSRGALLRQDHVYYHVPGDADVRALAPGAAAPNVLSGNLELARALLVRPRAGLFRRVELTAFGDMVLADGDLAKVGASGRPRITGDAGLGLEATHRLGQTDFVTRFDVPLFVGYPALAQDQDVSSRVGFRWLFSFAPGIP